MHCLHKYITVVAFHLYLSVVKIPLKGEVGGHALNYHGNYIVDCGKSWKNHGIVFLYPATKVWRGIMLYPSVSVRPSVRPCSPFPIDNLSINPRNFFKFCIHIVIGDEWYGIVNGQNPSIFNGVTALFRIGKMISGLLFLYCS